MSGPGVPLRPSHPAIRGHFWQKRNNFASPFLLSDTLPSTFTLWDHCGLSKCPRKILLLQVDPRLAGAGQQPLVDVLKGRRRDPKKEAFKRHNLVFIFLVPNLPAVTQHNQVLIGFSFQKSLTLLRESNSAPECLCKGSSSRDLFPCHKTQRC